jgi:hypothetical protein
MSIRLNGLQFTCDWCTTISEERPLAPSGVYADTPLPDGWTSTGYGSARNDASANVHLKDMWGTAVSHLCPACSAKPVGEFLTWLGRTEPQ